MNWQGSLLTLLGTLRALKWTSWNSHWQVKGKPFYGDHLMLERIYQGEIDEQIDTLGEKLVFMYGGGVITNGVMRSSFLHGVESALSSHKHCALSRVLYLEKLLQNQFKLCHSLGQQSQQISLGMDDYLMATANQHETFLYLLKQRLQ
jgi:DNA-binding ferritin-like protein